MCNYQTLYHDDKGSCIILCNECDQVQIAFGILVLTLSREQFQSFNNSLQNHYEQDKDATHRTIVMTSCKSVTLLLNAADLVSMKKMVDAAETELRTIELMSLFN